MSFPIRPAVNEARLQRNSLAGTVRAALMRLEVRKITSSPHPEIRFEVEALEKALAALVEQPPERGSNIDREVSFSLKLLEKTPIVVGERSHGELWDGASRGSPDDCGSVTLGSAAGAGVAEPSGASAPMP